MQLVTSFVPNRREQSRHGYIASFVTVFSTCEEKFSLPPNLLSIFVTLGWRFLPQLLLGKYFWDFIFELLMLDIKINGHSCGYKFPNGTGCISLSKQENMNRANTRGGGTSLKK